MYIIDDFEVEEDVIWITYYKENWDKSLCSPFPLETLRKWAIEKDLLKIENEDYSNGFYDEKEVIIPFSIFVCLMKASIVSEFLNELYAFQNIRKRH